jgi:hypothetical protein
MRTPVIMMLVLLTMSPVRAAAPRSVQTDGLGFPVYPRAVAYAVFALDISYIAVGNVDRVIAWYRTSSGRRWTETRDMSDREGTTHLLFDDDLGVHHLRIRGYHPRGVLIEEALDLTPQQLTAAVTRARELGGHTDPIGMPLYPRRSEGQSLVLAGDRHGLVTYATPDSFESVFGWFNARLPSHFALSYNVDGPKGQMRTWHGSSITVTVTRRKKDGNMTVIGVQRVR